MFIHQGCWQGRELFSKRPSGYKSGFLSSICNVRSDNVLKRTHLLWKLKK